MDLWHNNFPIFMERVQRESGLDMQVSVNNPDFPQVGKIDLIWICQWKKEVEEYKLHVWDSTDYW